RVLQQRELWLSNAREIAANDQLAWEGLLQSDPIVLQQALDDTADPVLSGWLSLGLLAEGGSAGALQRGLTNWRRRFPGHPAMRNVVTGFDATAGEASVPQRIALLLTLSGRSQVVGQAVRDGFLSHYANRFGNSLDAPAISIYDIADVGATRAYQLALDEGAQFIVGPLLPSAAAELASYSEPQVPSLLLNYPETTARSTPPDATADDLVPALGTERIDPGAAGWMRFGLAPEDEAAAAAARAYADGHRRALALVPSSRWGERVLKAFNSRFVELGGEVMAYEQYIATETDYSNEIERLMLLTDSVARYRRMRSLLGGSLQFEPRRRADSDLIFMAANADSGRRLKPQFRFHYAGDLPVYATANVHEVNRRQPDSDLNGVQFTDIAWLVDGFKGLGTPLAGARRDLATAQSQPRLFALGYDAFEILLRLHDAEKNPRRPFAGATGTLRLEEDGAVRRAPPWAQFERGRPVALPDAPLPASWMELPDDNAASIRLPRR
ncbi:MAG: penicillin-binding protein activator, partial [Pseudomonadota bacterium]